MTRLNKIYGQASRSISTGKLNALPRLHTRPINLVISQGSLGPCGRDTSSRGGLRAYMLSSLIPSDTATRRCPWRDNRNTGGPPIPVLSY